MLPGAALWLNDPCDKTSLCLSRKPQTLPLRLTDMTLGVKQVSRNICHPVNLSLLITFPASPLTPSYHHFPALCHIRSLRLLHFHHPLPCGSLSYSLGVFIFSLTGAMAMFGQDGRSQELWWEASALNCSSRTTSARFVYISPSYVEKFSSTINSAYECDCVWV